MAFSGYTPEQVNQIIDTYERRSLEQTAPQPVSIAELLGGHSLVRLTGMGNFWDGSKPANFSQHVIDFVIGAHAYQGYLNFVLTGGEEGVQLYYGLKTEEAAGTLLRAAFPGVSIDRVIDKNLEQTLQRRFACAGMLSGIPSPKYKGGPGKSGDAKDSHGGGHGAAAEDEFYHFERLVRGMQAIERPGAGWILIVQAYALDKKQLLAERRGLLDVVAQLASLIRANVQETMGDSTNEKENITDTRSRTIGMELVNKQAEYAVKLLESEIERINACMAIGRWQVGTYFGSSDADGMARMAALLTGILSGPDSRPVPLRFHACQYSGEKHHELHTYLTSTELALLVRPLREEYPGFEISDLADFDVTHTPNKKGPLVKIGNIQVEGHHTNFPYTIPLIDLTRHGVVFGVTGSGKTTTMLGLLHQLSQRTPSIPFLVIEPAKTEYRALLGKIVNGQPTGPLPNLRVYTLGSDTVSPFRLNPFEFDLGEKPGSASVLSHIDFLKAVFNSAFILYAPMPYVLETALYEIYEDCGWNLATETNVRLPERDWANRDRYPIFPTLTDLYNKVDVVTARLGYESRVEQDVIAGLKARLGAMRLGPKGLMLDTSRGIPFSTLLKSPVVLEMENIGNDDEKTFLIGLLLARLYGYRRLQATEGTLPDQLQHILVVEEAHRLLKNVSTQVDTESSNLRAQAIETFVNMLSEIRHYQQGVLVAEQIPSKLTPDIIKNTNLKVVHRIMAEDDRRLLGESMNMNDAQIRRLSTLQPGEAVVYAKDDDHPLLLTVENSKTSLSLDMPRSADLPSYVEHFTSIGPYLPTPDFASYGIRMLAFAGPDAIVYQSAMQYLNWGDSSRTWARLLLRLIYARDSLPQEIEHLKRQILVNPLQLQSGQYLEALLMLLVLGASQALQQRGMENNWPFSQVDTMRQSLTNGLVRLARSGDLASSNADLDRFTRSYLGLLRRSAGPYPGCQACSEPCVFRAEVRRLLSPIDCGQMQKILARKDFVKEKDRYDYLRQFLTEMVQNWLGEAVSHEVDIAYCACLVAAPAFGLDEYERADMAQKLAGWML